jgi:hypothetical protein
MSAQPPVSSTVSQRLVDMLRLRSPRKSNSTAVPTSTNTSPRQLSQVTTTVPNPLMASLKPLTLSDDGGVSDQNMNVATPQARPPPQAPHHHAAPAFVPNLSSNVPSQEPMTVYPALDRLYNSARKCALPPSRTTPAEGTPNYPSVMLALTNTMPPNMTRSNWCLADYAVVDKLYKGEK